MEVMLLQSLAVISRGPALARSLGRSLLILALLTSAAMLAGIAPAAAQTATARPQVTVTATPGTVLTAQPVTVSYSVVNPNPSQPLQGSIGIDFGDGSSQQVPAVPPLGSVVHTFSNPGVYTLTVSATNIGNVSGQGTTSVTVAKGALPPPAAVAVSNGCNWTGLWDTGIYGQISLVQSGSSVTGAYAFYPNAGAALIQGQINATASGTTLTGTWAQGPTYTGQDAGAFTFTMATGCNQFSGQWRMSTTPSGFWDGTWNGTRMQ